MISELTKNGELKMDKIDMRKEMIKGLVNICRTKPFYGHVIQQFEKVYVRNPHSVDTAMVGRMRGEKFIKLYLNMDYGDSIYESRGKEKGYKTVQAMEEHEILHVCHNHLSLHFDDKIRGNVAVDCVVNGHLNKEDLMENWCTAESYDLPKGKSAVWYYNNLKMNAKFQKQLEDGAFGLGGYLEHIGKSHASWEELEKDPLVKEYIKDTMRKAKELCNGYGNIPAGVIEVLEGMLKREKAIVPWGKVLRTFCASAMESVLECTTSRESKRFGTRPGTKKGDVLKLVVVVDTSGSIDERMLKIFFNEIRWIWRNGALVDIIEADCIVAKGPYRFKGRFDGEVHGRGGTDLEPALKVVEGKYDACIYFTDFQAPKISRKYRVPVLWVLTEDMSPAFYPADWGRKIRLDMSKIAA
jgi:predicted metal-dependent peptidase